MIWFAPYAVAGVVHLVVLAAPTDDVAALVTKALLMPLLAVAVVGSVLWTRRSGDAPPRRVGDPPMGGRPSTARRRPAWFPPLLVALAFSWFGDLALDGSRGTRFLVGIGFFLVAQLAYIVAFRTVGDRSATWSPRPWLVAPYVAWWVGFLGYFLVANGPEPLLAAVAVYGVALGAMACLAHRVNVVTAIGAASFLVSDSLIGLNGFAGVDLPLHDVWVMSTYIIGQGLIAIGLVRLGHDDDADPRTRHRARSTPTTPG